MSTESELLDALNYRVGGHYYTTLPEAKAAARDDARLAAQDGQNACINVYEVVTGKPLCQYISTKGARKHKVIVRTP